MTRYVMSIDLRRCVGCQTCTAACKNANATPPGVQWRRVLDLETGEFPDDRHSSSVWGMLPPRSYFRFDDESIAQERESHRGIYD